MLIFNTCQQLCLERNQNIYSWVNLKNKDLEQKIKEGGNILSCIYNLSMIKNSIKIQLITLANKLFLSKVSKLI